MKTEKCYNCNEELVGEYQVMIYEPNLEFVKCCCMDCAEELKKRNEEILYDRAETVRRQSIQILKKELLTPREIIERFIKKNRYTYKVEDILNSYQDKFLKGYYVSFTMEICIENLENEIRELLKLT